MGHLWVQGIFIAVLLSGECHASSEGSWCYIDEACGPTTWESLGHCDGDRQSPIDIISSKAISNSTLGPVTLSKSYEDPKKLLEMKNTGKTVDVELGEGLFLSGPGLPGAYMAKSFHFHWGDGVSKPGSEHYIDGRQYSMELHIVHTRNNMSVSDALDDPQGIAVLGFFVQGSETAKGKTAKAWESLSKNLQDVKEKGEDKNLHSTVSLQDLLGPTNLGRYFRYSGSLTTPGCDEVVIWTVFADPILVPSKVVAFFPFSLRSTDSSEGPHLKNNFRPLQKISDRKVETSAFLTHRSAASRASQPVAFILLFLCISAFGFFPV
ncbi:carbonic anhydrase 4-like [Eublepharis macularius]|uniref:Carbonic anhydrase n=1 Tax=Eublepharis macularius TaxID=481883 RepID=A0AA97LB61_EUBMA|nr:carbonic anhydrase 4-like [Eublepharis macularius]